MFMPTRPKKPKRKKIVTPDVKRAIAKAERDLAAGKGITLGELLVKMLEHHARKHAA